MSRSIILFILASMVTVVINVACSTLWSCRSRCGLLLDEGIIFGLRRAEAKRRLLLLIDIDRLHSRISALLPQHGLIVLLVLSW